MQRTAITYWAHEGGNIAPIFMICLTAIIGMVGAALTLSLDTRAAQQIQYTTDESALTGATAFLNSKQLILQNRIKEAEEQARLSAEDNSEYHLRDFEVISVSDDPFQQSIKMAVEVEFQPSNATANFTGRNANVEIRRRAVAEAVRGFPLCILTLNETVRGVRLLTQNQLTAENCIIWSNSKTNESISLANGRLIAKGICAAGKVKGAQRATPTPETGCKVLPDPLAGFEVDVPATCDHTKFKAKRNSDYSLKPGVYCGGLELWHMDDVEFAKGIYVIRDGPLKINAKKPISIEGVTFLMDGALAGISIDGDGGLTMRAPEEGETAGIAIAQNVPRGDTVHKASLKGKLDLQGLLYLPSYHLSITQGGGGTTKSPYIQMVVDRINLYGDVELNIDFDPSKTKLPVVIQPEMTARLIE